MSRLDIRGNRRGRNYSAGEMVRRVFWILGEWMIRCSPRPCFGWRRMVLRLFGATIGEQVHIYSTTRIYFPWNLTVGDWSAIGEEAFIYNLGPVKIGNKVTVSHRAHLCAGTHDYLEPSLPLLKKPIELCDESWVCADAFVGPGVSVGEGAIVGARAVVMKDVTPWWIVAGNPARPIRKRILRTPASRNGIHIDPVPVTGNE